jgi:uncharacterized membrane protein
MSNKLLVLIAVVAGVLFLAVAAIYFTHPANSLPNFFPGYDKTLIRHHTTHAIGAFILGIGAFIFAWFQSGKKSSKKEQ